MDVEILVPLVGEKEGLHEETVVHGQEGVKTLKIYIFHVCLAKQA